MKYNAMRGIAMNSGRIMASFLGENNALTLAMSKAVAIADVIIQAQRAKMGAMALSPATGGQPAVSWIQAQQYISLAAIAAQTFVKPKEAAAGAMVGRAAGTPATGDHQLYKLSPGELVSPRDTAQAVVEREAAAHASRYNDNEDEDEDEDMGQQVTIELSDDASDFIFAQQRQNRALATGVY